MKQMTEDQLKQLLRNAFEKGWCESGQGCNAEHHNLEPEELVQMCDSAVEECIKEFEQ